ncbi:MAG: lipoyl(octanoyl) transferase LipB [Pseudomonadota bacterium]|nr:lipoyl(octanoyl) transferase LipB [Pseudomonadota bacterium]
MWNSVKVKKRGLIDYENCYREMRLFTNDRNKITIDEIWWLEHPSIFTLGTRGNRRHILHPKNIPIIETDRGGEVTYHGPGQLIVYFLLDLDRSRLGVRKFVCILEQAIIDYLKDTGIKAQGKENAPGVFVNEAKIASIGLRIRHKCSYHGISLNVNMDPEPFSRINPCGYPDLKIVNTSSLGGASKINEAALGLIPKFLKHLKLSEVLFD